MHAGEYNIGVWIFRRTLSKIKTTVTNFAYCPTKKTNQWVVSPRWNLEFNLGAGYVYLTYDKYPCVKCGTKIGSGTNNYFGVTKAAISLIYLIK